MKKYIIPILIVCLIASIIINIVSIIGLKNRQIMDCSQIGLSELIGSDISEAFIDEGNNPNLQGVFDDPVAVEQLFTILERGCYQHCSPIISNSAPGSNSFPFIRLKAENHTYAISVMGNKIRVTVDGESKCYYSNIRYELLQLINNVLVHHFTN